MVQEVLVVVGGGRVLLLVGEGYSLLGVKLQRWIRDLHGLAFRADKYCWALETWNDNRRTL